MEITLTVIFALLGMAAGSFINVCIDRLPAGKSLISPPSHCDRCQHPLAVKDLVPVLSYLWLRGRCRYCRARLPRRSLLVELACGFLVPFSYWFYGLSASFIIAAAYSCLFVLIIFMDWEHQLILNKVTCPAALAALAVSFFYPPPGLIHISLPWPLAAAGVSGVLNSLLGGAVGLVFFLVPILIYPAGMGWGDVKLAALIGLVAGFPVVLIALFIGIVTGGLVAIALLLTGKKGRKDAIPYGTFLGIGPIVTLFYGSQLLMWYLGLL